MPLYTLHMNKFMCKQLRKAISIFILVAFMGTSVRLPAYGMSQGAALDSVLSLPAPGSMVHLSPSFNPLILKGIKLHTDNPFRFDFILDQGDSKLSNSQLKAESTNLIKYFLASITIPEQDLWVNLSPYEKNRIVPGNFGLTDMGRDLLAEDYMLKQITASLIYPEDETGKKFWNRIYEEAAKRYGTTNVPVHTFNKIWIVPEKAVVYENAKAGIAYVVESKLKVMLEQDYLSLSKHQSQPGDMALAVSTSRLPSDAGLDVKAPQGKNQSTNENINALGSQVIREIVIPELTKEVNYGKNFAQLRQVYNSLILATWYKEKIKASILDRVYADKEKIAGINIEDPLAKEKIYQRYLKAFKKGVYNYIKEELDPITQETIPRKYFSGGFGFTRVRKALVTVNNLGPIRLVGRFEDATTDFDIFDSVSPAQLSKANAAMVNPLVKQVTRKTVVKALSNATGTDGQLVANVVRNLIKAQRIPQRLHAKIIPQLAKIGFSEQKMEQEKYYADLLKEIDIQMIREEIGKAHAANVDDKKLVQTVVDSIAKMIAGGSTLDVFHMKQIKDQLKKLGYSRKENYLVERKLLSIDARQIVDMIEQRRHEFTAEEILIQITDALIAQTGATKEQVLVRLEELKINLEKVRHQMDLRVIDVDAIHEIMRDVQRDLGNERTIADFYELTVLKLCMKTDADEKEVQEYLAAKVGIDMHTPQGKFKLTTEYETSSFYVRLEAITKHTVETVLASLRNKVWGDDLSRTLIRTIADQQGLPAGDVESKLESLYRDQNGLNVYLASLDIRGMAAEEKYQKMVELLNNHLGQMTGIDKTEQYIQDTDMLKNIFKSNDFKKAIVTFGAASAILTAANKNDGSVHKAAEGSQERNAEEIARKLALRTLYLIATVREIRTIFEDLFASYAPDLQRIRSMTQAVATVLTTDARRYLGAALTLFGEDGFKELKFSGGRISKQVIFHRRDGFKTLSEDSPQSIAYEFLYNGSSSIRVTPEQVEEFKKEKGLDAAMNARDLGGIDLTVTKSSLEIQNSGQGIKFHLNPAMLARLQNAQGFVPVIINLQPMQNLSTFFGLADNQPASKSAFT